MRHIIDRPNLECDPKLLLIPNAHFTKCNSTNSWILCAGRRGQAGHSSIPFAMFHCEGCQATHARTHMHANTPHARGRRGPGNLFFHAKVARTGFRKPQAPFLYSGCCSTTPDPLRCRRRVSDAGARRRLEVEPTVNLVSAGRLTVYRRRCFVASR